MKILDIFRRKAVEKAARRWGRWNAKSMMISFLAMENHYKGVAPTYAWLARKVLLTRSHWEQVGEITFCFDKSDQHVDITDDMTLLQVMHIVIDVEYAYELRDLGLPAWEQTDLLRLAHAETDRCIKK
jgi:hypothetical protein